MWFQIEGKCLSYYLFIYCVWETSYKPHWAYFFGWNFRRTRFSSLSQKFATCFPQISCPCLSLNHYSPVLLFYTPLKTSENLKVLKVLSKESFIYYVRKTFRKINIFYFPITLWQSDKKINVLLISARSIIWSVYYIKQKFLSLISANIFLLESYFCWVGTLIAKIWFYIFQKIYYVLHQFCLVW